MRILTFELPIDTVSELNTRDCRQRKAARAREQRIHAKNYCSLQQPRFVVPPTGDIHIHLTRLGPKRLDSDNVQAALKAIRDGVCDWLGIKDGIKDRTKWYYDQQVQRYYKSVKMKLVLGDDNQCQK